MNHRPSGTVMIHDTLYETVPLRVKKLRQDHPDWSIVTSIESNAEEILVRCEIWSPDHATFPIATGHASERRGGKGINATSALENCETSAVGRALAFLGYTGTSIATDEEIERARAQQLEMLAPVAAEIVEAMEANGLVEAVTAGGNGQPLNTKLEDLTEPQGSDLSAIADIWRTMTRDEVEAIFTAQKKGGPFTHKQRQVLKSTAFREALEKVKSA